MITLGFKIYIKIFIISTLIFVSCKNYNNYKTLTNKLIKQYDNLSSISIMKDNSSVIFEEYKGKLYTINSINSNFVKISILQNDSVIYKDLELHEDKVISYGNLVAMTITDNYILLIVTNYDTNYLYYFNNDKSLKFIRKTKLDNKSIKNLYALDSLIYFSRSYNYHPKDEEIKSLIEVRNINTLEIIKSRNLLVNGIEFTHFEPYRNIDFLKSNGMIIYSDLNNFKIRLLDKNLNLLDSIEYSPKYWSNTFSKNFKDISDSCEKINPLPRIKYLGELFKNGLSKIMQIGFINDTTFYVAYHSGKKSDMDKHLTHIDILRIRNGKILKYKEGLTDIKNEHYIPIILSDNIPIFENGRAYFFTFYDYNSIYNFIEIPDWIRFSLSMLTGNRIKMNLIVMDYYDL